ncbi:MAG: GTP cyclohydrolase II, partial [Betaproteobacteria bacterium]
MLATEAVSVELLGLFTAQGVSTPRLVMTGTRANVLGIDKSDRSTCVVSAPDSLDAGTIEYLANPLAAKAPQPKLSELIVNQATPLEMSCVKLAKLSRLLP